MILQRPPIQVTWIFSAADLSVCRELLDLAAVLEVQGLIKNWSRLDVAPGQSYVDLIESRIRSADIVMICASPAQAFSELGPRGGGRWVIVQVRPTPIPRDFSDLPVLPRDGEPLVARKDRREGLLDVIRGLQEVLQFDPSTGSWSWSPSGPVPVPGSASVLRSGSGSGWIAPLRIPSAATVGTPTVVVDPATAPHAPVSTVVATNIHDIFRLDGPPTSTFVEPPRFDELKSELRTMGTGLIVEGPSKVGKSTAIKKALEALGVPAEAQTWWHGQAPPPLEEFQQTLTGLRTASRNTWLFIDDFHYLEAEDYRRALATAMKLLADQATRNAKVTLIGINPLGSSLVQVMPDLAGRFRVHRVDVAKDLTGSTKVAELILLGEREANIRFRRRDEFVIAAAGSFFLAQWLCNRAAVRAGVFESQPSTVDIDAGPAEVISSIQDELAARFRMPMLEFAAFDATPPPRGAGLSLLWLLSRSAEGFVPVKEARLRFPMLEAAFDWFLVSNLARCFREHPQLRGLLYYNGATTTLTMEDPQLRFYLRELDWAAFAEACGHGHVTFDHQDGPLWPRVVEMAAHMSAGGTLTADLTLGVVGPATVPAPADLRRLLHLSDLHFATKDQATTFYAALQTDLRGQGIDRLDALVVSGDLTNRASADEFDAARLFLEKVMSGFGLSARQVALVPGNHDGSWTISKQAYDLKLREDYREPLRPGTFIAHGADAIGVRDEDRYRERFAAFAELYRHVKGTDYPLDYAEQATLDDPAPSILILGLNSAWDLDHHYKDRVSIHAEALAHALSKLGPPSPDQLRVAVFHHPLNSGEDARLRDHGFLEQLAVHGFRLVLHGHVHRADNTLFRYDHAVGGRQIEIVAAGTFGARSGDWSPGVPLQYNLLLIGPDMITVETRCRENVNGAWKPDARWQQGPGKDPLPRYLIKR